VICRLIRSLLYSVPHIAESTPLQFSSIESGPISRGHTLAISSPFHTLLTGKGLHSHPDAKNNQLCGTLDLIVAVREAKLSLGRLRSIKSGGGCWGRLAPRIIWGSRNIL